MIFAKVFFPDWCFQNGSFTPDLLALFFERYTDEATGWAAAHWNDAERATLRKASVFDGSIVPDPADGGFVVGCLWHPQFLADIANPPPELAEHFEGIMEVDTQQ